MAKERGTLSSAGAVEIVARPKIVRAAGAAEIIPRTETVHAAGAAEIIPRTEIVHAVGAAEIIDVATWRLADVADEEDATDMADPRRVSIRNS